MASAMRDSQRVALGMTRYRRRGSLLAMGLLTLAAVPAMSVTAAHADFRVCNATQSLVGVAIGYRAKAGWVTEEELLAAQQEEEAAEGEGEAVSGEQEAAAEAPMA